jgi:hypothetical protein
MTANLAWYKERVAELEEERSWYRRLQYDPSQPETAKLIVELNETKARAAELEQTIDAFPDSIDAELASRNSQLEQSVTELSDMIDGEHALNEQLIRDGQWNQGRIDALRGGIAAAAQFFCVPGSDASQVLEATLANDDKLREDALARRADVTRRTRWVEIPLDPDEPNPIDEEALRRLGDGDEVNVRDESGDQAVATVVRHGGFHFSVDDDGMFTVAAVEVPV